MRLREMLVYRHLGGRVICRSLEVHLFKLFNAGNATQVEAQAQAKIRLWQLAFGSLQIITLIETLSWLVVSRRSSMSGKP